MTALAEREFKQALLKRRGQVEGGAARHKVASHDAIFLDFGAGLPVEW